MNIVEEFLIQENLENYYLTTADLNDLTLGIIIGNLDKIKKISLEFCKSLQNKKTLHPLIKALFLSRVLQNLLNIIYSLPPKSNEKENEVILEFNRVSEIIIEIYQHAQSKDFEQLIDNYKKVFAVLIKKLDINDSVLTVCIYSYKLKDRLSLACNLFSLSENELIVLNKSDFFFTEAVFKIFVKGFEIIKQKKLPPSDLLSIIMFNKFHEFSWFLIKNHSVEFDSHYFTEILIKYNQNFTEKQKSRLFKVYNTLLNGNRMQINKNFTSLFSNGVLPSEPDYKLFKLSISQAGERTKNYSNSCYKYKNDEYPAEISEPVITRTEINLNDLGYDIKSIIGDLLYSLKSSTDFSQINEEYLEQLFSSIIEFDQESVYRCLIERSNKETDKNYRTKEVWNLILKIIEKIGVYEKLSYHELAYNIEYIKNNY